MIKTKFNAVTLEMLWTRLISIVDEAAAALVRTSFSTIVRESNDFACVLTDARVSGEELHESIGFPGTKSYVAAIRRRMEFYRERGRL